MSIIRIYVSNNVPGVEFVSWGPNETFCQCEPLWSGLGNILQLHAIFFLYCIVDCFEYNSFYSPHIITSLDLSGICVYIIATVNLPLPC